MPSVRVPGGAGDGFHLMEKRYHGEKTLRMRFGVRRLDAAFFLSFSFFVWRCDPACERKKESGVAPPHSKVRLPVSNLPHQELLDRQTAMRYNNSTFPPPSVPHQEAQLWNRPRMNRLPRSIWRPCAAP